MTQISTFLHNISHVLKWTHYKHGWPSGLWAGQCLPIPEFLSHIVNIGKNIIISVYSKQLPHYWPQKQYLRVALALNVAFDSMVHTSTLKEKKWLVQHTCITMIFSFENDASCLKWYESLSWNLTFSTWLTEREVLLIYQEDFSPLLRKNQHVGIN